MTRKGRRRGVILDAAGLVAGGAVVAARDTYPVGHFTSAAGQDRFLAAAINGEYPEQIAEDIEQFRLKFTAPATA